MYQNYIFDFYGTLVDIKTDETQTFLWKKMAELYRVYGVDYTPMELKKAYYHLCSSEEKELKKQTGYHYPEISLERIFAKLLYEGSNYHTTSTIIDNIDDWQFHTANFFRVLSRQKLKPYAHTLRLLKQLKREKCNIFILSNAQKVFTLPEMEQSGILEYVNNVYISSQYKMKKPQREFLETLIKKENINVENSIFVGNEYESDIAIAMANHMQSILVNTSKYTSEERKKRLESIPNRNPLFDPYVISDGDIGKVIEVK